MKMHLVVKQLKVVQLKARKELNAVTNALTALGANHLGSDRSPRVLSKAARKKIGDAQRLRWKQYHKQNGRKAA